MLLLCMTAFCVLFGPSAGLSINEVCYGGKFGLPFEYTPAAYHGKIYFTPRDGGAKRLVVNDGKKQTEDPRIKVSYTSVVFTDLRGTDEGTFSISYDGTRLHRVVSLRIKDCAAKVERSYGELYSLNIPTEAESLEYSPLRERDQITVLWNRTDPASAAGRGKMRRYSWEITGLTQADNGYYNLRKKDNTLLSRTQLSVKESTRHYDAMVNTMLYIESPPTDDSWTVIYTSNMDGYETQLMKDGNLVQEYYSTERFARRIEASSNGIEIDPVQEYDAGTFKFRDSQGNIALVVTVNVVDEPVPVVTYVSIASAIVFVLIVCCCCMKKCCCKKSSSKRNGSAPQTAAAVYHHDVTQPAGPSYSAAPASGYSYQPPNPPVSREPATTSLSPSGYNPVNIHVNPPQPKVATPAGQRAAPATSLDSDGLTSDAGPRFERKGLASTNPLSSDSTVCDVYTSAKLNFR